MKGLTNFITESNWKDIVLSWYVIVDDAYQVVIEKGGGRKRRRGPKPKVNDSEIITQGLILETWFQGHEEVGYAFIHSSMKCVSFRLPTDKCSKTGGLKKIHVIKKSHEQQLQGCVDLCDDQLHSFFFIIEQNMYHVQVLFVLKHPPFNN